MNTIPPNDSENTNRQPVISLQNVSKRFGKTQALDQVTLQVPPGVVFALLGENGAGKTTMIRILTGFEKPDTGTACLLYTSPSPRDQRGSRMPSSA